LAEVTIGRDTGQRPVVGWCNLGAERSG
jgi:hypothetical protein